MKKVFLLAVVAALFTGLNLKAQGLEGVWFAGGTFSMSTEKLELNPNDSQLTRAKSFTVLPMLGTFISPSLAIGGAIGYSQADPALTGLGEGLKAEQFIVQPLVRKYWNISGKLYAFAQAALPVTFGNLKDGSYDIASVVGVNFAFSPGLDLIVNDWLSIEASFNLIGISYTSVNPEEGEGYSNFSFKGDGLSSTKFGDITVGAKILF